MNAELQSALDKAKTKLKNAETERDATAAKLKKALDKEDAAQAKHSEALASARPPIRSFKQSVKPKKKEKK